MKCKHKLHYIGKIRKCVGHNFNTEHGHCCKIGFLNDPKGGGHKDYLCFVCEKCGEEIQKETVESKKMWEQNNNDNVLCDNREAEFLNKMMLRKIEQKKKYDERMKC